MAREISNTDDVIDSRDVIERIDELTSLLTADAEGEDVPSEDEREQLRDEYQGELIILEHLARQADGVPDWIHGETLIRDSYFEDYIRELVDDCHPTLEGLDSDEWPWRHMTMDWEAAASEAQTDYTDVDFDGVTYWIR